MEPPQGSLYVERLLPEQIAAIERRMRDPQFSEARFLSVSESLLERVRADAAILRELGITHEQIARRLEAIVRVATRLDRQREGTPEYQVRIQALMRRLMEGESFSRIRELEMQERAVRVGRRLSVTIVGFDGHQHCPFEYHEEEIFLEVDLGRQIQSKVVGSCGSASEDVTVENLETGTSIHFSELMIHLIREHEFFEGEGLRYRLDPKEAVETLGLIPRAEDNG